MRCSPAAGHHSRRLCMGARLRSCIHGYDACILSSVATRMACPRHACAAAVRGSGGTAPGTSFAVSGACWLAPIVLGPCLGGMAATTSVIRWHSMGLGTG